MSSSRSEFGGGGGRSGGGNWSSSRSSYGESFGPDQTTRRPGQPGRRGAAGGSRETSGYFPPVPLISAAQLSSGRTSPELKNGRGKASPRQPAQGAPRPRAGRPAERARVTSTFCLFVSPFLFFFSKHFSVPFHWTLLYQAVFFFSRGISIAPRRPLRWPACLCFLVLSVQSFHLAFYLDTSSPWTSNNAHHHHHSPPSLTCITSVIIIPIELGLRNVEAISASLYLTFLIMPNSNNDPMLQRTSISIIWC